MQIEKLIENLCTISVVAGEIINRRIAFLHPNTCACATVFDDWQRTTCNVNIHKMCNLQKTFRFVLLGFFFSFRDSRSSLHVFRLQVVRLAWRWNVVAWWRTPAPMCVYVCESIELFGRRRLCVRCEIQRMAGAYNVHFIHTKMHLKRWQAADKHWMAFASERMRFANRQRQRIRVGEIVFSMEMKYKLNSRTIESAQRCQKWHEHEYMRYSLPYWCYTVKRIKPKAIIVCLCTATMKLQNRITDGCMQSSELWLMIKLISGWFTFVEWTRTHIFHCFLSLVSIQSVLVPLAVLITVLNALLIR